MIVSFECNSCGATNKRELEAVLWASSITCDCCEFRFSLMQYKVLFDSPGHISIEKIDFDKVWDITRIVEQLKKCEYTCEAGPLELNTAFIALCKMSEQENRQRAQE